MRKKGNYIPDLKTREDMLEAIIEYKQNHNGNSPSFRQIMNMTGIPSLSIINYHLRVMEQLGMVRLGCDCHECQGSSRSIQVVGSYWELDGQGALAVRKG